jgi:hypothetical protein
MASEGAINIEIVPVAGTSSENEEGEDTVDTVNSVEEERSQGSMLLPWNWPRHQMVTRATARLFSKTEPPAVKKHQRAKVRVLDKGTNVLTAAQPIVSSAVLHRATSPVGRMSSPNLTVQRQSMDGTIFPLIAATATTSSHAGPVMTVTTQRVPVKTAGKAEMERPPRELTRREKRKGGTDETSVTRPKGYDGTIVTTSGVDASPQLEWQDMDLPPEEPVVQAAQQSLVEEPVAQAESDSVVEEPGVFKDAPEDLSINMGKPERVREIVHTPLGRHYGYVLWDTLQDSPYSLGSDGESIFLNIYEWRDLAILMTKELNQELLSEKWRQLVQDNSTVKVNRQESVKAALDLELEFCRKEVENCVFKTHQAQALSKEAEDKLQNVKKLNQQLKVEKLKAEGEVKECAIDAQDEVRRYGLLEKHCEALTSRVHELVEMIEIEKAKLASLQGVGVSDTATMRKLEEAQDELARLKEIIAGQRSRVAELQGLLKAAQQPEVGRHTDAEWRGVMMVQKGEIRKLTAQVQSLQAELKAARDHSVHPSIIHPHRGASTPIKVVPQVSHVPQVEQAAVAPAVLEWMENLQQNVDQLGQAGLNNNYVMAEQIKALQKEKDKVKDPPVGGGQQEPLVPAEQKSTREELDATRHQEWVSGKRKHQGEPPAPYDGKEDWEVWLTRFEHRASLYLWCEEEMGLVLRQCLTGAASKILKDTGTEEGTFKEMCDAIKQRFNPPEQEQLSANDFNEVRRKAGEDIDLYCSRWKDLFQKSSPNHPLEIEGEASSQNIAKYIGSLGDSTLERELIVLGLKKFSEINSAIRIRANADTSINRRYPDTPGVTVVAPKKTGTVKLAMVQMPKGTNKNTVPCTEAWISALRNTTGWEDKSSEEKAEQHDRNVVELKKQLQSLTAKSINEHEAAGTDCPLTTLAAVDFGNMSKGRDDGPSGGRTRGPSRGGYRGSQGGYGRKNPEIECFRCGGIGHPAPKCWNAYHQRTHEPLVWQDQLPKATERAPTVPVTTAGATPTSQPN